MNNWGIADPRHVLAMGPLPEALGYDPVWVTSPRTSCRDAPRSTAPDRGCGLGAPRWRVAGRGLTSRPRRCRLAWGRRIGRVGRGESTKAALTSQEARPVQEGEDHMASVTVYTNIG